MTQQPTLAHVPGILLRTLLRGVARIVFALASIVLLLGLALSLASLYLATFRSARSHRSQMGIDLALAITELVKSYR